MSDTIPKNQVRTRNSIEQHEHEDNADARRVTIVDRDGIFNDTQHPLYVRLSDGSINIGTVNAELEVQLSHKDNDPDAGDVHDSVRIGDGVEELAINPDGSINVNITFSASDGLTIAHNEISAVPSGAETTIISLVVPVGGYRISKIDVSGENVALFRVKVDGSTVDNKRSWWTEFNQSFRFESFVNGLKLVAGQVLTVTTLHNRPFACNFEATVFMEP